jgi:hypothetical protein
VDDFGAEEFFQGFEWDLWKEMEGETGCRLETGGWSGRGRWRIRRIPEKEAVGHEGVNMGMKIEVFAEGVQGHDVPSASVSPHY